MPITNHNRRETGKDIAIGTLFYGNIPYCVDEPRYYYRDTDTIIDVESQKDAYVTPGESLWINYEIFEVHIEGAKK
jgi:hypothetical protein